MKLIFHIGMGKCGSSSIQRWLLEGGPSSPLASRIISPGTWFDFIDPKYASVDGQERLFQSDDAALSEFFDRFVGYVKGLDSNKTFVLSNESLFEKHNFLLKMLDVLGDSVEHEYVMYTRDPARWLRSAYLQWTVKHKTMHNKIPSPREDAARLLELFARARRTKEILGSRLTVRTVEEVGDVVADFAGVLGLPPPQTRLDEYASGSSEEYLFRGTLNDYFPEPMEPSRFDALSHNVRIDDLPDHRRIASSIEAAHEIDSFIHNMPEVWDNYEALLGRTMEKKSVSNTPDGSTQTKNIWQSNPTERMIDFLFAHVVELHERINRLEEANKK